MPVNAVLPELLEVVERKICEGFGCGASFMRPVPANAKSGETICLSCRRHEERLAWLALERSRQVRVYRKAS